MTFERFSFHEISNRNDEENIFQRLVLKTAASIMQLITLVTIWSNNTKVRKQTDKSDFSRYKKGKKKKISKKTPRSNNCHFFTSFWTFFWKKLNIRWILILIRIIAFLICFYNILSVWCYKHGFHWMNWPQRCSMPWPSLCGLF